MKKVVIVIRIKKGGGGKTEAAVNLSAALSQKLNKKVLGVDLDEGAKFTKHLGINPETLKTPNLYDVFTKNVPISLAIQKTEFGFDLVPGHRLYGALEKALEPGDETMLKGFLSAVKQDYDFVILDPPAGNTELGLHALVAADYLLVPLLAQGPFLDSVPETLQHVKDVVWKEHNPDLQILGIFPIAVRRIGGHSVGVVAEARKRWGKKVLPMEVSETQIYPKSYDEGKPTVFFAPNHPQVKPYYELAKYIHEKT